MSSSALLLIALVSVACSAFLVAVTLSDRFSDLSRLRSVDGRLMKYIKGRAYGGSAKGGVKIVADGSIPTGRLTTLLSKVPAFRGFVVDLEEAGGPGAEFILRTALVSSVFAPILGATLLGSYSSGFVLAIAVLTGVWFWVKRKAIEKRKVLQTQLPEAFSLVGSALSSGASLIQALEHAVRESRPPIAGELASVVNEVGVGVGLDDSLDRLNKRLAIPELESMIAALTIQRKAGGNLSALLASATEMLKERTRLKGQLLAETSQARFSGKVVGLMPLIVMTVIFLIDPAYLSPLFSTTPGLIMLSIAIAAEAMGFVIVGRLLKVDF